MTSSFVRVSAAFAAFTVLAPVGLGALQEEHQTRLQSFPGDLTVDAAIGAGELRGHVQALASDAMRGRAMGSPESLAAARYLAERLEAMGVAPGGDDGTYMQRVPLMRVTYSGVPEIRVKTTKGEQETLFHGADFSFPSASAPADARPLRCVVVTKETDLPEAADAGVALIMATSAMRSRRWLDDAGYPRGAGFGLVLLPKKAEPKERSTPRDGSLQPVRSSGGATQISLRGQWSDRMAAGEVTELEFVPHASVEQAYDVNVVGVLVGAGTVKRPELADEIVILSAHRDHIGVSDRVQRSDPEADAIMNGADDDASGCAAILEIIEALSQGPRPARTTVVLFDTGEERGFVGSSHWVSKPTHPIESVVCALNFEMLGRPDDLVGGAGNVWLTGDERSDLGAGFRSRGIDVKPDGRPGMSFFTRSDNVPFAKAGIVAQTLSSYGEHGDYHKATDEWQTLDYDHMEAATGVCLEAARALVAGDWKPAWNEGEPRF